MKRIIINTEKTNKEIENELKGFSARYHYNVHADRLIDNNHLFKIGGLGFFDISNNKELFEIIENNCEIRIIEHF